MVPQAARSALRSKSPAKCEAHGHGLENPGLAPQRYARTDKENDPDQCQVRLRTITSRQKETVAPDRRLP